MICYYRDKLQLNKSTICSEQTFPLNYLLHGKRFVKKLMFVKNCKKPKSKNKIRMKTKMKKMCDLYSYEDVFNENVIGIFSILSDNTTYPNVEDFIDSTNYLNLDVDYLLTHSNEKFISGFAEKFYNQANEDVNTLFGAIATLVYQRFSIKWKKIYDALMTAYKPLENYDMEQTETPDTTKTTTQNITSNVKTEQMDVESDSSIYGFNSETANPSNKVTSKGTTIVSGDGEDNESVTEETETGTRTLTRHGNIGVTTSQQMLQSEIELRKFDFYKMIYNDIDSILCLRCY